MHKEKIQKNSFSQYTHSRGYKFRDRVLIICGEYNNGECDICIYIITVRLFLFFSSIRPTKIKFCSIKCLFLLPLLLYRIHDSNNTPSPLCECTSTIIITLSSRQVLYAAWPPSHAQYYNRGNGTHPMYIEQCVACKIKQQQNNCAPISRSFN